MKAAVFAPPISVLQLLEGLQKTLISCHLVRLDNGKDIVPPTGCPQLVLEGRGNDGNTFPQHPHSQCFCLSSISVPMYGFKKGQCPSDICMQGRKLMFSHSLLD